ncbi:MAG: hypothetical protein ACLQVL_29155 [Terriglobia bacterium]
MRFSCPYLAGEVELTEEREKHVGNRHPELLPKIRDRIRLTLAEPYEVRRSARSADARLFSRWFDDIIGGKHVVVVVVSERRTRRHWVVTAYVVSKLGQGVVEWTRN